MTNKVRKPALPSWDELHNYQFPPIPDSKHFEDLKIVFRLTRQYYTTGSGEALFERMQYIRGSENLCYDLGDDRAVLYELADRLVEYYSETIEHHLATDV